MNDASRATARTPARARAPRRGRGHGVCSSSWRPATCRPRSPAALLVALRNKGETAAEIRGFALGMRELARRPAIPAGPYVDVVGTGGDGSQSLNLSTGSALLAAAAGVPVVKHGNRSISSRSGSADVLAALGLPMPLDETAAAEAPRPPRLHVLVRTALSPRDETHRPGSPSAWRAHRVQYSRAARESRGAAVSRDRRLQRDRREPHGRDARRHADRRARS